MQVTETVGPAAVRRIAIVEDDVEMAALLGDLLEEQGSVTQVSGIISLTALAEASPDVIVLGLNCSGGLPPWELVELIRQHRTLHAVPIVVTTLDVAAAMRVGYLSTYQGIHAVEVPCEVELLQGVVARIQPCSEPASTESVPLSRRAAGRLPDICPHGYSTAVMESCRVCRAVGTEFALASIGERSPYIER